MTNLKAQTEAKIAQGRQANPEFMGNVDRIIEEAKAFEQGKNALTIGANAPNFSLPNVNGTSVELAQLLKNGPVILTFYRGDWCPYCNLQLRALASRLPEIHDLGAQLVAISPQVPDDSMTNDEISQLKFTVLSDQNAKVAATFGVAWEVPEYLLEHMRVDRKLDLEAINNGNKGILPIPATFIITKDGIIKWRYLDVDYRTRAEPDDIINALTSL